MKKMTTRLIQKMMMKNTAWVNHLDFNSLGIDELTEEERDVENYCNNMN
jgi:hypothetical protein